MERCWSCDAPIPERRVRERVMKRFPRFMRESLPGAQLRMGYGICPTCRQRFYVFYNRAGRPWVQPDMIPHVEDSFPPRTRTGAELRKRAWMRHHEAEMAVFFSRGRKGRREGPPGRRRPAKADPYRVLGVARGAPRRAIDKAFRERAKRCHPDRVAQLDSDFVELAHRKFHDLKTAYDAIIREISEGRGAGGRSDDGGRRR